MLPPVLCYLPRPRPLDALSRRPEALTDGIACSQAPPGLRHCPLSVHWPQGTVKIISRLFPRRTCRGSQASGVPQPFPRSSAEWAGGRGRRRSPRLGARRADRALSSAPARREEALPPPPRAPALCGSQAAVSRRPTRPPAERPAAWAGFVAAGQGRRSAISRALKFLLDSERSTPAPRLSSPHARPPRRACEEKGDGHCPERGKGVWPRVTALHLDVLHSVRRPQPVPRHATDGPRGTVRTARLCPEGRSSSVAPMT
ncbi:uncharacterized protein LOC125109916 [Lutra lutra]|uniref:uncharacterized protein LOC125109916 n=1 Tax=Lutra lutra TaxID=9657 RepID=UPI001FD34A2C|nr:uncharacterized protein LOC125109916 [Lutra lutra]